MDEADERVDMEEEEEKEENEEEREVQKNKQVDDGEEIVVKEAGEVKKVEQQGGDEVDRWVKEKEDEEKEWEAIETNEFEEFEGESCQEEGLSKNKKGDKQMTEADESVDVAEEKGQEDNEIEREVKENEEVDEEEEWERKEAKEMDGERENKVKREMRESEKDEELQEQEQSGRYHLEEQVTEQIPVDNIQQNQESAAHENDTVNDSVELMNEDSENEFHNLERLKVEDQYAEKQHEDSDKLEDPGEKSWRSENEVFGVWTTQERNKEDESEKLTDEEGTATESWTSQEEFQYYLKSLQEEDSKDEEEAAHSMDEDGEGSDEDEVKDYSKDDYPTDIFLALNEFRESSLLTDLTLSTDDGKTFQVHSPVLAAVSSLIWKHLNRRKVENMRAHERQDDDTNAGAQRWSVYLGPEVDHVGLETIVEFAYTGLISSLNEDNVDQIRAAAQALGVSRVLNLCTQQEEEPTKTGGQKKKERTSAAQEMMISLESIKQLWMDRVGCDVILEALGASLHVHRVILAVSSDYFRGMFTLGMKESHQPSVTLPLLLASELEALIDCSYSGALPLSWRCVFELTSTALQLQYQPALSLCLNFLHQEITPDSCLDVISFAEAYGMTQLLEVADDFVLRQFQKVACTSKFKDLPARQLLKYLNSCSLCVPSELVVFKAVAAWIQAKPRIRSRLAKDLMKTIHFPLMTFKEFKEVQSQNMWSDHNLSELYKAVFEDFCSTEPAMENKCRIYLPKESLVLIGGDQITEDLVRRNISRELWFGNSLRNHTGVKKAMEWRKLGEMPEPERFRHEVAVLKGQLYVFGGKMYYGINDTLSSVYRYDPLQNSWESLADMQEKRCSFSAVVLDGNIYTIGGHCHPDYIDSVERYCATTNTWSFTWPLDLPLSGHVAKVAQGRLFVSGGQNSDYLCLASMFLYHPETGSTYLANMPKPRAHHCMETLGEHLYVAGGVTTADNMTVVDQLACEVYSPAEDSWTAFTSLSVPHVGAASAVLEGKFYVLGGYSQEDFSDTKMVHRYDRATWRWENMGKMPGPNSDIRASVLYLPQHFRM
uniref:BTB domain-containing protein n=2 Tax=Amphiprion ocellaris TaxID=80972 RepID=A0AAQ5Z7Z4_AMPOC